MSSLERLGDVAVHSAAWWRELLDGAPHDGMSRRDFLALLGASAALAGVSACARRPRGRILPYAARPPELTPGVSQHYATAMTLDGYATGLVVASREGRPIKIEGNPDHPASLGASGVFEQASLLDLYDPARARVARDGAKRSTWAAIRRTLAPDAIRASCGPRGEGLHLLLEPTTSPLVGLLLDRVRATYPDAHVHFHTPLGDGARLEGARLVAGSPLLPQLDVSRADVIVALEADLFASMPFGLRYARDFAARRQPGAAMNRLYVAESTPSPTGSAADHRVAVRATDLGTLATALLDAITVRTSSPGAPAASAPGDGIPRDWLAAVADDLVAHRSRSVVVAGPRLAPAVHAVVLLINDALGNVGQTARLAPSPVLEAGTASHEIGALVDSMRAGSVRQLVIAEGNPAYASAPSLGFAEALRRVPRSLYLGLHENETARACSAFVPGAHYLESWGDARAYDGTLSIVQPLIAPLYGGHIVAELLATLAGDAAPDAYTLTRGAWRASGRTDAEWRDAVRRGVVSDTATRATGAALDRSILPALRTELARERARGETLELTFPSDASVYDGRLAGNAWLQELPDPVTKLAWDNAARVSPATASRLGVATGDVVRLRVADRTIEVPAIVVAGQADDSISLALGYGRDAPGSIAHAVGANAYRLADRAGSYAIGGLSVERVLDGGSPARRELAITQRHWSTEGRGIAPVATLAEYRANPHVAGRRRGRALSIYQEPAEPDGHRRAEQWAMTIDLGKCTGCSACVVACQAENNIPVVGRDGVANSREMHWLRIDRYDTGGDASGVVHQPMLCQHCEKAPCEYVCPVNATVHSGDGLNEMVYNRCVGTRFCSNNCPYKVRRFNWFDYNAELAETERMAKNPDVTVRARGVMEKCTFCVQRIRRGQIDAEVAGRALEDGDVVTACQQACPTRAIIFGDVADASSAVAHTAAEPRAYAALDDLATEPRVRYLARVSNPNPVLGAAPRVAAGEP